MSNQSVTTDDSVGRAERDSVNVRAADAMARAILRLVDLHRIDSRSAAADAMLNYAGPRCGVHGDEINALRRVLNVPYEAPVMATCSACGSRIMDDAAPSLPPSSRGPGNVPTALDELSEWVDVELAQNTDGSEYDRGFRKALARFKGEIAARVSPPAPQDGATAPK